ncbi:MAG: 3-hydroxyacyl-ACP dehydratase FabZ [Kiritimatiellia bacterium]|nr:3-hydroxyacyl-ACP dehydratase FabZ [Kiritimatiellia bacterium]
MATIEIKEIMQILPHRYPMLLIDRVLECDDKQRIVAIKNITINEPFFEGHFPGTPIMPGVLQLEAMAQAGGILLSRITGERSYIPLFMVIDKARFRKAIVPGDQMRIEVTVLTRRSKVLKILGKVLTDGQLASEAELLFMLTSDKMRS